MALRNFHFSVLHKKRGESQWKYHGIFPTKSLQNFCFIWFSLKNCESLRRKLYATPSKMTAKFAWKSADSVYHGNLEATDRYPKQQTRIKVLNTFSNIAVTKFHEMSLSLQGIPLSCFQSFRWFSKTKALKFNSTRNCQLANTHSGK